LTLLHPSPDLGRVGFAAAVVTGLLALTASAASSRAQNVAGANPLGKSGSLSRDLAYALAIQRDGRLVVAGRSAYGGWRFALARYTAGGKLDPSFGSGGKVMTNFRTGRSWEAGGRIRGSTSARGRECRLSRRSSTPARHRINPV